ncbi:MAG: chalcone isomerase family protein [Pseudomonadota bacterium]
MTFRFKTAFAAAVCAIACTPTMASINTGGIALDDSVLVAGKNLKLNGAGVSFRLIFKVYAMGLYLLDRKETAQDVLATAGPRRIVIAMLRDVSSDEFNEAVMNFVSSDGGDKQARIAGHMLQLGKAIASQPKGLRKGDTLTLDWVPDTGTVIELNKKLLTEPLRDIAFYNALLNIWLGDKPADSSLKTQLLGKQLQMSASAN